uniref:Uncharacterized protein n=1 Tax=Arundo donax TaxID=35708 RepID=A0A0A9TWZ4_ARUDO
MPFQPAELNYYHTFTYIHLHKNCLFILVLRLATIVILEAQQLRSQKSTINLSRTGTMAISHNTSAILLP